MRATAMPSSARRLRCASSWASDRCMTASAVSARPISLPRPLGAITREASCGLSPKAMMLEVSRRTGRSTMLPQRRPQHAGDDRGDGQRDVEEIARDAPQRLDERRLVERRPRSPPRPAGAAEPSFTIVPGAAKSVAKRRRDALEIGTVVGGDRPLRSPGVAPAKSELAPPRRRLDRDRLDVDAVQDLSRQILGRGRRSGGVERLDQRSAPTRSCRAATSRDRRSGGSR